jgi:hypothetical protein
MIHKGRKPVEALFAVTLAFAALFPLGAIGTEDVKLHLRLARITGAAQPEIFENSIIFTLSSDAEFAGIVFGYEDYSIIHPFERVKNGLMILAVPIPEDPSVRRLEYRYVADGAWFRDPSNANYRLDGAGIPISIVDLPPVERYKAAYGGMLEGRLAHFKFKGDSGKSVYVAGSFNGWDPFMYRMDETSKGLYELDIPLAPGIQYYAFVADGKRYADPLNPELAYYKEAGIEVSVIRVPRS